MAREAPDADVAAAVGREGPQARGAVWQQLHFGVEKREIPSVKSDLCLSAEPPPPRRVQPFWGSSPPRGEQSQRRTLELEILNQRQSPSW